MTKDNRVGKAIALTARDAAIVRDVAEFRALTREQLTRLGHFQSKTRANATLLRLVGAKCLTRRFQPLLAGTKRSVLFLGSDGAALLGYDHNEARQIARRNEQISLLFLDHLLMINEVRLAFRGKWPEYELARWLGEEELRAMGLGLIPDGAVEYRLNGKHFTAFVEADRGTETLERIRQKARAYKHLASSGTFERSFQRRYFRVLVVCPSSGRLENLRRAVGSVTEQIFWLTTAKALRIRGPFAPIWLRPTGQSLQSLTQP